MRLPRPSVSLSLKLKVAARQLVVTGRTLELIDACSEATRTRIPLGAYLEVLLRKLFGDEKCHLDHDPPLMLRQRTADGGYDPPANDPRHLVWRTAEEHRIKTYVRGDGAQLSDAGKRRKEIKRRKKGERPKRRWPSRPIRGRMPP